MDLNLSTTSELKNRMKELEIEYNKCQTEMAKIYSEMEKHSKEYNEISSIIAKREGKNG